MTPRTLTRKTLYDVKSGSMALLAARVRANRLFTSFNYGMWNLRMLQHKTEVRQFDELNGPSGVYKWPIVGLPLQFKPFTNYQIDRFDNVINAYKQIYGDIFKMRLGFDWHVFLCDPDDFATVFRMEGRLPHRPPLPILKAYFDKKKQLPSLFLLNGEQWVGTRSAVQKSLLKPNNVTKFLPTISSIADDWMDQISHKGEITDVPQQCLLFTLEVMGALCFNTRFGSIDPVPTQMTKDLINTIMEFFKLFGEAFFAIPWYNWVYTKTFRRLETLLDTLGSLADKHLLVELSKLNNNEEYVGPNLLLDLVTSPELSQEMIARNLIDLFIAGVDSTAQSLSFLFYHLAANPNQQQLLHTELESVLQPRGDISKDQLQQLPYLKACCKESSRLIFPVVGAPIRCFDRNVTIHGYNIPKGTILTCVTSSVSKDERYFSNPDEFLPERWLMKNKEKDIHPFSHLPFGLGLKSCVGKRFAEQEILTATAKMIRNYKLSLPNGMEELQYVYKTFATAAQPFNIKIEKR